MFALHCALVVLFALLGYFQMRMWEGEVLPMYLLPVGALALVVAAAGLAFTLLEEGNVIVSVLWFFATFGQGVALAAVAVIALRGEEK